MASRRDMIRMDPEEITAFLGGRRTLNIASFGPDGNIHLVAMWYGFLDSSNVFDRCSVATRTFPSRRICSSRPSSPPASGCA